MAKYYMKIVIETKTVIFSISFFEQDFSYTVQNPCIYFYILIHNDLMEGSMSQKFGLGLKAMTHQPTQLLIRVGSGQFFASF